MSTTTTRIRAEFTADGWVDRRPEPAPCPTWCELPTGHPYDVNPNPDDHYFTRFHEAYRAEIALDSGELLAVVVDALEESEAGSARVAPASTHLVGATEDLTPRDLQRLAVELVRAADELGRIGNRRSTPDVEAGDLALRKHGDCPAWCQLPPGAHRHPDGGVIHATMPPRPVAIGDHVEPLWFVIEAGEDECGRVEPPAASLLGPVEGLTLSQLDDLIEVLSRGRESLAEIQRSRRGVLRVLR